MTNYRPVKRGKQDKFTEEERDEVFLEIIELISEGKSVREALSTDKARFPTMSNFFRWITVPHLRDQYYVAREIKAHKLFDEMLLIASGQSNDGDDSICRVQRDRLTTDVMKFYISKVLPKVYGDKIDGVVSNNQVTIISLGQGIAPPEADTTSYIDVTPNKEIE